MKKKFQIWFFISLLTTGIANAQAFSSGDKNFNIGVSSGYGLGLNASVDVGVSEMVSIGAIGAFSSRNYGYLFDDYRVTYLGVGGRVGVHFGNYLKDLGIDESKIDPYVGLVAGFRAVKYSDAYSAYYNGTNAGLLFGAYGGVRYYFKEKLGLYVEGGFPYSSLGLTFKF